MARKEFLTKDELNEILGSEYQTSDDTQRKIYEASELIHYHSGLALDYTTLTAPYVLKQATAYQLQYTEENGDDGYASDGNSFTIGKYSNGGTNMSASNIGEFKKIAPKSNRLMAQYGLLRR